MDKEKKTQTTKDQSQQEHVAAATDTDAHAQAAEQATDETKELLTQCQSTLAEWQEKYARLTADLENYQKRTTKERSAWADAAQEKVLLPILSIVDNFDRAMEHSIEVPAESQSWVDGIGMIYSSFKEFLKNAGVQEVSYDTFNPELHEALMQVDSDETESGDIVSVMEKGYMLNEKVLRPAKVSVAK